jgi:hypothetical protein
MGLVCYMSYRLATTSSKSQRRVLPSHKTAGATRVDAADDAARGFTAERTWAQSCAAIAEQVAKRLGKESPSGGFYFPSTCSPGRVVASSFDIEGSQSETSLRAKLFSRSDSPRPSSLAFSADNLRNDATGWAQSEDTFVGLTAPERLEVCNPLLLLTVQSRAVLS